MRQGLLLQYSVEGLTIMNAFPQAAKTYLERHFESFPSCSLDQLIQHALKSLQVRGCTSLHRHCCSACG